MNDGAHGVLIAMVMGEILRVSLLFVSPLKFENRKRSQDVGGTVAAFVRPMTHRRAASAFNHTWIKFEPTANGICNHF